jgi:hypothetical protein
MWELLKYLVSSQTNLLWVTLISLVISTVVSYVFKRWETRDRLKTEYEYEQRRRLRDLIGRYHGRLLYAANNLNRRFRNLYTHDNKNWLSVNGDYSAEQYYFLSFVHRFLNVCCLVRQFEREAHYVDAQIAEKRDFLFLKYLSALQWCMTDAGLFRHIPTYPVSLQRDHFFADNFRYYCDSCIESDGNYQEFDGFVKRVQTDRSLDAVLEFFDGLSRTEGRYRWDRLVAFHLLLAALISAFGYPEQQASAQHFDDIAKRIKNKKVLKNLVDSLSRYGLARDAHAKKIIAACAKIAAA